MKNSIKYGSAAIIVALAFLMMHLVVATGLESVKTIVRLQQVQIDSLINVPVDVPPKKVKESHSKYAQDIHIVEAIAKTDSEINAFYIDEGDWILCIHLPDIDYTKDIYCDTYEIENIIKDIYTVWYVYKYDVGTKQVKQLDALFFNQKGQPIKEVKIR